MNQLEQLSKVTVVVADSGDIAAIEQLQPTEATTNPSLILQASQQADYQHLLVSALKGNETGYRPQPVSKSQ